MKKSTKFDVLHFFMYICHDFEDLACLKKHHKGRWKSEMSNSQVFMPKRLIRNYTKVVRILRL